MSNELTKRRAIRAENAENGIKNPKTADSLGWMIDITNDSHSFDYAGAQTGLTFAAIHTTSDLLTKAMYNLVTYPEYFELIRREMLDVLQEEGWKKTALYQMKLLDSFLKETQRLQGPSMSESNDL